VVPWGAMLGNYLGNKFWGRMSMTNPERKHVKVNSPMEAYWWNSPRNKTCSQFLEETFKGQFMWGSTSGVIFKRKNSKGISSRKHKIFLLWGSILTSISWGNIQRRNFLGGACYGRVSLREHWSTPKLLDRLKCESKVKTTER